MTGGKSTPKKDKAMKVTEGEVVTTGKILVRGKDQYKAGVNVKGRGTLYALCPGKVYFSRKKAPRGTFRTLVNVAPESK